MNDDRSNIHKGHRKRLRKRFIENGLNSFQPHEIIEFILFYSIPRANTNEIAHNLIKRFGSVYGVLQASPEELNSINGISCKSIEFIKTFSDVCHYYLVHENLNEKPTDILEYVKNYFSKVSQKMFLVIILSPDMTIKSTYTFMPDASGSNKIIHDLAMMTMKNQAHDVIIAHNCNGEKIPVPSREDYFVVRYISESLRPLGVCTADYIISNGTITFSMYQKGVFSF